MNEDRYSVVYRCPKCSYESTVTNVCRTCMKNMYATGKERNWRTNRKRRLRKGIKNYEEAVMWNGLQFASDRIAKRKSPEWAFNLEAYKKLMEKYS